MTKARIEHIYNCSVDTFWSKLFFDEEYNKRLFLDALEFDSWKIASFDETDSEIRRVVDAVPKMGDLPGPLKKLAEGGVGYRETGVFDKKSRKLTISVEPRSLKKLHIKGVLHAEPAGENKCKRIYETTVEAQIFGIGGLLEKRVLSDIQNGYEKGAAFTNRYIAEKGY